MGRGAQRAKANNYNLLWLKQKELVCDESSALIFSPPCGSCSVFEVAHTAYKYALNKCSFGCGCPTRVIPRERSDRGNLAVRRTHQADNLAKLRQEFLSLL